LYVLQATLKGQYTSRNEKMGSEKKPLNPVLGELFFGTWPDQNGRGETTLTVEQVSHHPPITAYCITNAPQGLVLTGHNAQKTSFTAGSIVVKQVGHAILAHKLPDGTVEKYLITLPRLRIDGLWYGSPYIELTDTSYIVSSTGYTATIEYKGKGYFGGKSHQYKATLVGPTGAATIADGLWDSVSKITSTKSHYVKAGEVFVDVMGPKEEVTVKPVEEQGEWETRKLWELVAKGIRTGDHELASREKTKIEVSPDYAVSGGLTLIRYWACRMSSGRGERMKRLLGHRGSSSTLSTLSPIRIVSPARFLCLSSQLSVPT
jgi:oxysterol-binding protein-related protein 9/10/11